MVLLALPGCLGQSEQQQRCTRRLDLPLAACMPPELCAAAAAGRAHTVVQAAAAVLACCSKAWQHGDAWQQPSCNCPAPSPPRSLMPLARPSPPPHPPTLNHFPCAADLPVTTDLLGQYTGSTYDEATKEWGDSSTASNTIVTANIKGTPQVGTWTQGGKTYDYVYGSTSAGVTFPWLFDSSSPYTLIYLCKWVGRAAAALGTRWKQMPLHGLPRPLIVVHQACPQPRRGLWETRKV